MKCIAIDRNIESVHMRINQQIKIGHFQLNQKSKKSSEFYEGNRKISELYEIGTQQLVQFNLYLFSYLIFETLSDLGLKLLRDSCSKLDCIQNRTELIYRSCGNIQRKKRTAD